MLLFIKAFCAIERKSNKKEEEENNIMASIISCGGVSGWLGFFWFNEKVVILIIRAF